MYSIHVISRYFMYTMSNPFFLVSSYEFVHNNLIFHNSRSLSRVERSVHFLTRGIKYVRNLRTLYSSQTSISNDTYYHSFSNCVSHALPCRRCYYRSPGYEEMACHCRTSLTLLNEISSSVQLTEI